MLHTLPALSSAHKDASVELTTLLLLLLYDTDCKHYTAVGCVLQCDRCKLNSDCFAALIHVVPMLEEGVVLQCVCCEQYCQALPLLQRRRPQRRRGGACKLWL